MFNQVDKSWKEIMRRVQKNPLAIRAGTTPGKREWRRSEGEGSLLKREKGEGKGGREELSCTLYIILVHVSGEWAMRNDSLHMCMYF